MKYPQINNTLFIKNRKKLISRLKENSLVIVHSNDEMPRNGDQDFTFRQNSDMFYLTGIDQEQSVLLLCPQHPEPAKREVLLVKKTSKEMEIWYGHKYTKQEATNTSGIKNVQWLDQLEGLIQDMAYFAENIYLNLNENPRFSSQVPYRDIRFVKQMQERYPLHNYERLAPILTDLRVVKEAEEIELMQKACDITGKAFNRILKFLKPGVMEYEVEAEITHEYLMNRATGHSYSPIIASGKSACILHYVDNNKECKDGELLLMDFGAEYANYAGDCSRTIPVNGKFTDRQRQVYEAVLRVQKQAIKMLVPGITIFDYHIKVGNLIEEELIQLGLITREEAEKVPQDAPAEKRAFFKYYMHGTSHYMGLDVHDVGHKHMPLKKGMVFSCEPGIYIPEEGIGIRIENDIVVDDNPIDLMKGIPREVDEIEAIMNS